MNLLDRKLANLIAMAYVCFIWGLGTTLCLITPNFYQCVDSVQYSAVLKVYLCCRVLSTPGFWWGKLCSIPVIQSFAGLLKTKQRWDLPDLDPLWWLSANWYLLVAMVMAYVCLIRGLRHNFNIVSLITPNFRQYSAFFWLEVYLSCCAPSTPTVFDGIDCAQSIASSLKIVAQPFFFSPTSSKIVENMWLPCLKRRV